MLQITKQICKVNSEPLFTAALTVTNEFGEIRVLAFVATKSHSAFESALVKMQESLDLYGHSQPRVAFTDNPLADKPMLEAIFNSLKRGVVPVEKYPGLKPFTIPENDVVITVHNTPTSINGACDQITDDLDPSDENARLITGLDAEWNVNMTSGGGPEPTAVVQIAYKKRIYILQVCSYLSFSCNVIDVANNDRLATYRETFRLVCGPFSQLPKYSKVAETSIRTCDG